jgi:6-phosphogluconolactonase
MKKSIYFLASVLMAGTHFTDRAIAQVTNENFAIGGAVYAMTNDPSENEILVYNRDGNGQLHFAGAVPTHGTGSGGILDPLQSQSALAFSADRQYLFAVNPGSGTISSFLSTPSQLFYIGNVNSGGAEPISIAVRGSLLYVLDTASISGFRIQSDGRLEPIPSSTRYFETVGGRDLGSSDIVFSPDGRFLVVPQRDSNQIVVFPLQADGTTGTAVPNTSSGNMPFACAFTAGGVLVVTEADGGPTGAATSSYVITSNGTLQVVSASIPTQGAAPCWDVVSSDGRFAIVTNAGASVETLFSVAANGQLTFISTTSAGAGVTPLDTALTPNNQFLYTLDAAAGEISEFRFDESSQSLVNFGSISVGLTPNSGMNGLQAR